MNIFVTGGSGFFGQRLVTRLIKEQYQVTLPSLPPLSTPPF